jgi:hypothetical protein
MSGGYLVARENFKEAEKHVSAEKDPVMFNLLYGLLSLTDQLESDFTALRGVLAAKPAAPAAPAKKAAAPRVKRPAAKKKTARGRASAKKRATLARRFLETESQA